MYHGIPDNVVIQIFRCNAMKPHYEILELAVIVVDVLYKSLSG